MANRGIGEVLVGAAVLLVGGFSRSPSRTPAGPPAPATGCTPKFDHIDGLNPRPIVRIAGVKVAVSWTCGFNPETFLAEVTLSVDDTSPTQGHPAPRSPGESLFGWKFSI